MTEVNKAASARGRVLLQMLLLRPFENRPRRRTRLEAFFF